MRTIDRFNRDIPTADRREAIQFPVKTPTYHPYEEVDVCERLQCGVSLKQMRADRKFAPYQPGDTMLILDSDGIVKLARVMLVFEERNHHDEFIPKWKVQVATRSGHWSLNWKYVFPGSIYRAHFTNAEKGADTPRKLPEEMTESWMTV